MTISPSIQGGSRNDSIDILKFLAAILITNSHMSSLYPSPFTQMVTVGGIVSSFGFALIADKFLPKLFFSFRDYTYQIFLMGIFAQMFVKWYIDIFRCHTWQVSLFACWLDCICRYWCQK